MADDELLVMADRGVIVRGGRAAVLPRRQFALFLALYEARPRVVSYDTLIYRMYDHGADEPEHALSVLQVLMSNKIRPEIARLGLTVTNAHKWGYALDYTGPSRALTP